MSVIGLKRTFKVNGKRKIISFMRSITLPFFLIISLMLIGCGAENNIPMDRKQSPDSAFALARQALHKHDLVGYFDTLTLKAVRLTLQNSIGICSSSGMREVQDYGYSKSVGCEDILNKYGWKEPTEMTPDKIQPAWDKEIAKISDPRKMVVELETNHRRHGAGSSFVWNHLDPVELSDIVITGTTASAKVKWDEQETIIYFEKDDTGWRFDPFPDD